MIEHCATESVDTLDAFMATLNAADTFTTSTARKEIAVRLSGQSINVKSLKRNDEQMNFNIVKNRRFAKMMYLMEKTDFFTLERIKERSPAIYSMYITESLHCGIESNSKISKPKV